MIVEPKIVHVTEGCTPPIRRFGSTFHRCWKLRTTDGLVQMPQVVIDVDRGDTVVWPENQCRFCWALDHVLQDCPRLRQFKAKSGDYWCAGCGRRNHHLLQYCCKDPDIDRRRMEERGLRYEVRPGRHWRKPNTYDCTYAFMNTQYALRHLSADS